jgi:hypothetical protein
VRQHTDSKAPCLNTGSLNPLHYKELKMLETIVVLLVLFWLLGMVSSYTLGGFIHILLVIAVVVVLLRVIRGRSPL